MPDIAAPWGTDLALTPSGDLAVLDGPALVEQRIIRRLFTRVKGMAFHLDYGAGIPQRIGRPADARTIQAIVRAQMRMEATVARTPLPVVTVTETEAQPGLFVISIIYSSAITGRPITINLTVPSR